MSKTTISDHSFYSYQTEMQRIFVNQQIHGMIIDSAQFSMLLRQANWYQARDGNSFLLIIAMDNGLHKLATMADSKSITKA